MTYDAWKTRSPDDEPSQICEHCGEELFKAPEGYLFCDRCTAEDEALDLPEDEPAPVGGPGRVIAP